MGKVITFLIMFLAAVLILFVMVTSSRNLNNSSTILNLSAGSEILVPDGYEFVDATAWGAYSESLTLFCREKLSGRIYRCTQNEIKGEVRVPKGYEFVGASSYGGYTGVYKFYCRELSSG